MSDAEIVDFIVVGAGSAGCAIAEGLSRSGRHSVLLLESGRSDREFLIRMPRGVGMMNRPGDRRLWTYTVSLGSNRSQEEWIKGRAIGGSSSVNGMIYARGFAADYDGWRDAGCSGWGWDEIGRLYRSLEDHVLGAGEDRGVGGPLPISMQPRAALIDAIIASAAESGLPATDDVNDRRTGIEGGIGYQPRTIFQGRRCNAARAFLERASGRANLKVRTGVQVRRVLFERRRATGVLLRAAQGVGEIQARREVIVAAGALESPRLLQLSGIGPAGLLAECGVPLVTHSAEVGRNLIEHRYLSQQYRVNGGSFNRDLSGWRLFKSLLAYGIVGRGVLTHAAWEATAFIKSDPAIDRPDGQVGIGLYSMKPGSGYGKRRYVVESQHGLTIGAYAIRPASRGTIAIVSQDPDVAPAIDANFLATEGDRRAAVGHTRWIRHLMRQPALAPFAPLELTPGPSIASDEEIIDAYFTMGNSGYHVAGTCRMGVDEAAVLDPRLRVRGVDGLRVADTSIMPAMVSGNTNGPAMVIGMRAAELILEDAG